MAGPSLSHGVPRSARLLAGARAASGRVPRDALHLLLGVLVFLTISRLHQRLPAVESLRPAAVLVVVVTALAVIRPGLLAPALWLRTRPGMTVLALGAFACGSALFGISLGASARFILETYSKVIVLAVLVMAAVRVVSDLRGLTWAFVLGLGALVWMAFFVFKMSATPDGGLMRLSNLETWDANDFGCVLLTGMGLVLLLIRTSKGWPRAVAVVILVSAFMAIARTGSRGALVGLGAFGVALLFSFKAISLARRLTIVAVALVAVVLTAPPGYWSQMDTITNPTSDYNWTSYYGRKELAKRGVGYMLSRPVFGLGPNNFGRAEGMLEEPGVETPPEGQGRRWVAPHNTYVQAGAEMGLTGLFLWLMLTLGGVHAMIKLRRQIPRDWQDGDPDERFLYHAPFHLMLAMVGFVVTSSFVTFAYLDPVYLIAAMMAGTTALVRARLGQPEPRTRRQGARASLTHRFAAGSP